MNLQMMCLIEVLSKVITLDMQEAHPKDSSKEQLKANTLVFKKELRRESLKDLTLDLTKDLSQVFEECFEMHEQKIFLLMV